MKAAKDVSHFQFLFPCPLMATLFLLLFVGQAAKAQQQWQGTVTAKVHGPPANAVWPFFADFCNFYRIFPLDASFCTDGVPGRVGQVRYIASKVASPLDGNVTYVRWEQHKLTAIDPINRSLSFDGLRNNLGVNNTYRATMSVLPATYGCQLKWDYLIDRLFGFTSRQFQGLIKSVLQRAAGKIEDAYVNIID